MNYPELIATLSDNRVSLTGGHSPQDVEIAFYLDDEIGEIQFSVRGDTVGAFIESLSMAAEDFDIEDLVNLKPELEHQEDELLEETARKIREFLADIAEQLRSREAAT